MRFKPGVKINSQALAMSIAIGVVERVCLNRLGVGYEPTVTSIDDGDHGQVGVPDAVDTRTKHGKSLAFDIRVHDMLLEDRAEIFVELHRRLTRLGFDVLWEGKRTRNEHWHIEWDPKE